MDGRAGGRAAAAAPGAAQPPRRAPHLQTRAVRTGQLGSLQMCGWRGDEPVVVEYISPMLFCRRDCVRWKCTAVPSTSRGTRAAAEPWCWSWRRGSPARRPRAGRCAVSTSRSDPTDRNPHNVCGTRGATQSFESSESLLPSCLTSNLFAW